MPDPVQPNEQRRGLTGGRQVIVRLLLLAAIAIDGYLAWTSLKSGAVAGCGPDSNCHAVLTSKWAYWFGVPVGILGLGVYGCLLLGTFLSSQKAPAAQRRKAWQILLTCAMATIGAGLWFISIQAFVLGRFCPYCLVAHGAAMTASVLILLGAPIRPMPEKTKQRAQQVYVAPGLAKALGGAAVAALAILIVGQVFQEPRATVSNPIAAGIMTNPMPAHPASSTGRVESAYASRSLQLFDGKIRLNLADVPLIGKSTAPHVVVSLFDYTCHHCRDMHTPLMDAYHRFSNELAIVNLPMPLDSKCNPIIKKTPSAHINACALARIGLTVWKADPQAGPTYDDWVFAAANPPEPATAEAYARQLIGADRFNQTATNSWIDRQIAQDVAIYETSYRHYKKGYMPQIIIGTNLVSGVISREQLFRTLSEQFGLKQ